VGGQRKFLIRKTLPSRPLLTNSDQRSLVKPGLNLYLQMYNNSKELGAAADYSPDDEDEEEFPAPEHRLRRRRVFVLAAVEVSSSLPLIGTPVDTRRSASRVPSLDSKAESNAFIRDW
jgi:hypothetical protein